MSVGGRPRLWLARVRVQVQLALQAASKWYLWDIPFHANSLCQTVCLECHQVAR